MSGLVYGTDYDQISTWDSDLGSWRHWVNDPDFNDFTTFEYGKSYEIYNKTAVNKTLSITNQKSPAVNLTHNIKVGDNFISPAVKSNQTISALLGSWGLALGTHISDIKRFNSTTQVWESYAAAQFTQFEFGKGYNIIGLQNSSFSYGKTETTTTFTYDSTGARVKKVAGSTTTTYLGKDYEKEGTITTKYIFLGDRRITTKKSNGTIEYIHSDHINSSNIITDASGNQSGLLEYDPYGSTVTKTGSANPKHKYTGKENDDSTKLYYYEARYYDPQLGRFVTSDPTVQHPTDPQDFNRYAYARNNPIIHTDPTGLGWFKKLVAAVVGIAVGVGIFLVTGDPQFSFKMGVAAYRYTDALLNGAKWKEAVTAGVNGYGEGGAIFKDPRKAGSLLGDPTMDHLTSDGKRALREILRMVGLSPITAHYTAQAIEAPLTENNRSYAAITASTITHSGSDHEATLQYEGNGLEYDPLPETLLGFGIGFAKGVASGISKGVKEVDIYGLVKTHGINRRSDNYRKLVVDISKNGIKDPIKVVRDKGSLYVVNGHHRLAAARQLGYKKVPVSEVKLPYGSYRTVDDLRYEY